MEIDPRFYRRGPQGQLIELAPSVCPRGHKLGPGRVLVGSHPCWRRSHRTWCCTECGALWIVGECCAERAGASVWGGKSEERR